jgi:hypothetical protein
MLAKIASMPPAGKLRRQPLRRARRLLLAATGALLWLAALPYLIAKDALSTGRDGCMARRFRDPVSGRQAALPAARHALAPDCGGPWRGVER